MSAFRSVRVRLAPAVLMAAVALAACRQGAPAERMQAVAPRGEVAADAGAPVLAAVQNARAAIAAGDSVAAFNDVNLGLAYAVRLVGAESALYPPQSPPPGYRDRSAGGEGGGPSYHHHAGAHRAGAQGSTPAAPPAALAQAATASSERPARVDSHPAHAGQGRPDGQVNAGGPAPLFSFDAQVRLITAQAKLQAHDPAAADTDLQIIEAGAHGPSTPESLPLIRADQNLTLAADAVSAGRIAELRTQLSSAEASLLAYQGAPHAAEARALAAQIGEAMRRPGGLGTLAPAQVILWSGLVGAWT